VPYPQLIKQSILDPLGMKRTGFDYTKEIMDELAVGYDAQGNPAYFWNLEYKKKLFLF